MVLKFARLGQRQVDARVCVFRLVDAVVCAHIFGAPHISAALQLSAIIALSVGSTGAIEEGVKTGAFFFPLGFYSYPIFLLRCGRVQDFVRHCTMCIS